MGSGDVALVVVGLGIVCFLGFLAFLFMANHQPFSPMRQTPEQYFGG